MSDYGGYEFLGAMSPGRKQIGFATPIYSCDKKFFLHAVDTRGKITGFLDFVEDVHDFDLVPSDMVGREFSAGDLAPYAYVLPNDRILTGNKHELVGKLSRNLRHLRNRPFARLDVAAFIGNKKRLVQAVVDSRTTLNQLNPDTSSSWAKYVWDKFGVESAELDLELLNQFSIALISLYRKYVGLIHASNGGVRINIARQYAVQYNQIFEFLLDENFERVLFRELQSLDDKTRQLAFNFEFSQERQMRDILVKSGARGGAVRRFFRMFR